MNRLAPVSRATLSDAARDRLYTACAQAISTVGTTRESLLLARLVLLLMEQLGDEALSHQAIVQAVQDLPTPSLSALSCSASIRG